MIDGSCLVDETRVIIVHTIDIGPDLDFLGEDCSADKRCGIIAAATLEIVDFAKMISADKTLSQNDLSIVICFDEGRDMIAEIG